MKVPLSPLLFVWLVLILFAACRRMDLKAMQVHADCGVWTSDYRKWHHVIFRVPMILPRTALG